MCRFWKRTPSAGLWLLVWLHLGCVAPRQLTWEDASATYATRRPLSAVHTEPVAPVAPSSASRADEALASGPHIDLALATFRAARAEAGRRLHHLIVEDAQWSELLERLEEACRLPPSADDFGAFVRARVTLEVELQADRSRRDRFPPALELRIAQVLSSIDDRVNELRLNGSLAPLRGAPRLWDGVLVLRPPLDPLMVTSPFGVRNDPVHGNRRFHAGIDLAAPTGTMVYAAAPGYVIFAGWQGGFGRHIVVDHGDGIRTHYSHLHELYVRAGARVEAGDTLGAVGATGRATGPHLHFAVSNMDGQFLDPLPLLGYPLTG